MEPRSSTESLEDKIANLVLAEFEALPSKFKPASNTDGTVHWVPLSGIVVGKNEKDLSCVALATGMKCLPAHKVSQAQGFVLHDWHAEILALRGLNHFLIEECVALARSGDSHTSCIRRREPQELSGQSQFQRFTVLEGLKIHMYCSEAPCGDGSMELTMNAQQDATPWPTMSVAETIEQASTLHGRGYFSKLGIVRRKPSRSDSPPTLSKSCSDKLSMKQCTSLLSSPAALLISPENAYLHSLILPYTQYVPAACQRAFSESGRMKPLASRKWPGGYAFRPFDVRTTQQSFAFSNPRSVNTNVASKGSNISALWTPNLQEILISGVLQGRKQSDMRGGSAVCRKRTWKAVAEVLALLAIPALSQVMTSKMYSEIKSGDYLEDRRRVKTEARNTALRGWVQNTGDDFKLNPG